VSIRSTEKAVNVPLRVVRRGSRYVTKSIRELRKRRVRIVTADAENRTDLKNIAAACLQSRAIPCGSAGLAEEVAAILQTARPKIMILSSSTNEATLKELQRSARNTRIFPIRARARALLDGNSRRGEISRIRQLTEQGLKSHDIILICSALYRNDFDPDLILQVSRSVRDPIASGLAAAISPLALSGIVSGVLLTGGEMAAAFLKSIQATELRLEKEILPGIPLSTVTGGKGNGLKIVTKAGGFGSRGSMIHIVDYLISR